MAWLKELIQRSSSHEKEANNTHSYGETLLLVAIHFHGHTLEPIIDLVCSTLGIKLRPTSLTKIKILFTQQVFPEKVSSTFLFILSVITTVVGMYCMSLFIVRIAFLVNIFHSVLSLLDFYQPPVNR